MVATPREQVEPHAGPENKTRRARTGLRMGVGRLAGRARGFLPVAAIVALALLLRLAGLTQQGLWVDEGYTVYLSSQPLTHIVIGTSVDQHPPLYYILLKAWMLPFGRSEWSVRGLSALVGTATVLLVYLAGRRMFSPAAGEWAALALAVFPSHVAYSQEVRMYGLLALLATASAYLGWRAIERPGRGVWAGHVLTTLAALYTQNFALFILLAENLVAIPLALIRGRPRRLWPWLAAQGLLLLGYAPWALVVVYQTLFHQPTWIGFPTWRDLAITLLYLIRGTWQEAPFPWIRLATWGWMALIPLAAGLWAWRRPELRRPAIWTWSCLLIPLAAIFGLSQRFRLFQPKQFLFLLPFLSLLIGLGLAALPRWGRAAAGAALVILLLPGLHTVYSHTQKQAWRALAAHIDRSAQPGDCIYFNAAAGALTLNYYLKTSLPQDGYPFPFRLEEGGYSGEIATPERVKSQLSPLLTRCQRVWLVEYSAGFWDPQRLIRIWLDTYARPVKIPAFHGLEVRLYQTAGGQ